MTTTPRTVLFALVSTCIAAGSAPAASALCPSDIDQDGEVSFGDVLEVLSQWGPCAGPAIDSAYRRVNSRSNGPCRGGVMEEEVIVETNEDMDVLLLTFSGGGNSRVTQTSQIREDGLQISAELLVAGSGCAGGNTGSGLTETDITFTIQELTPMVLTVNSTGTYGSATDFRLERNGVTFYELPPSGQLEVSTFLFPGTYRLVEFSDVWAGKDSGYLASFDISLIADLSGGQPCTGDVDSSGVVDFDDLLTVIDDWGACG
ncbi:MAG: hypothetical protein AB8G96_14445 [Phycisphaerales bacterium]